MGTGVSGAAIVELSGQPTGKPMRFRVGDAAAIAKGDLLWYYDGAGQKRASGAAVTEVAKPFAGIANTEKVAGDGTTNIGCDTSFVADMFTDGGTGIVTGDRLMLSGANLICRMPDANTSGAYLVGYAMEDAGSAEKILVRSKNW